MRIQTLLAGVLGSLTFALAFSVAPRAEAAPKLAGELDVAIPIDATLVSTGAGGAIRFGYELRLPLISLTPEVGGSFHSLGDAFGPRIIRGFVGGRLGFGEAIRPGVFAHFGVGNLGYGTLPGGTELSHTSTTLDGGVFLDFTLLPIVDLGVHAGYNTVAGSNGGAALKWINAGAHIAIAF